MELHEPTIDKLYTPRQIALAAFLGSPVAGCWFFARNYRQLGDRKAGRWCFFWGCASTAALFVLGFFLPAHFPGAIIPIAYCACLDMTAKRIQGKLVEQYLDAGVRKGSWWTVVWLSTVILVIVLLFVVAVGVAVVYATGWQPPS